MLVLQSSTTGLLGQLCYYHPRNLTELQQNAIFNIDSNLWSMAVEQQSSAGSGGSLLDRVLLSQQSVALEHFDPADIVNELLKQLSTKETDVLRRRFALGQEERETLEKIGQRYHVTRERVRQIERWAIDRLRHSGPTRTLLHDLDVLLQQVLEEHGGLMRADELFQALHSHSSQTAQSQAAIEFLLHELMTEKVERRSGLGMKPYWKLRFGSFELMPQVIAEAERVIREVGKPMDRDRLLAGLRQRPLIREQAEQLSDQIILSYLSVAKSIERNPYGEYGLRSWGSIIPRRMHDKILLVMRKHGQPLHFQEITQKINEMGFDQRQAYPPTVHNELILNDEYVLVGRGIYALREWGYQPGVVADVLASTLRQAGRPLAREELVEKVLQQRMVKRNTIHLALTNKQRFHRLPDGRYELVESASGHGPLLVKGKISSAE
ncbi:MAG: hypothetical protein HYY50_02580 [Candidatus Kerfeldbacteria bacterium]|nr:hypothetical protein [Candidatus Kerfeldbacteria bacterium]